MEVKRNEKIGYFAVISGVILVGLAYFSGKTDLVDYLVSFSPVIIGLSYIKGTLLTVTDTELTLYATIGPLKNKYPIQSKSQLVIDGNRIVLISNGNEKKLPIYKWLANAADWRSFVMFIQQK